MNLEQNKKNAIAYYQMAYDGQPRKAVELYVGDEYIQHNPLVADGKEAFIAYFERIGNYLTNAIKEGPIRRLGKG